MSSTTKTVLLVGGVALVLGYLWLRSTGQTVAGVASSVSQSVSNAVSPSSGSPTTTVHLSPRSYAAGGIVS